MSSKPLYLQRIPERKQLAATPTSLAVYCDGGCWPNPGGVGGYGWIIAETCEHGGGSEDGTTNNRMELRAVIAALTYLREHYPNARVEVVSDSQYALDGSQHWLTNWKRKGWLTGEKGKIKNLDLWQEIDALRVQMKLTYRWVRGHSGDYFNEITDTIAEKYAQESKNAPLPQPRYTASRVQEQACPRCAGTGRIQMTLDLQ